MSDRHQTFSVGQRPRLELRLATGDVRILPGSAGVIEVAVRGKKPELVIIEQMADTVVIRQETGRWTAGSFDITVHAPLGTDLEASLSSTDLTIEADVNDLQVSLASGDVRARSVLRDATVKTASGDVEIDEVNGKFRATSASGDVTVGVIGGDATCSTASGEIVVGVAKADLAAKSASGDVTVDDYRGADLRGKTVSGDMQVGVARGQRVDVDLQSLTGNLRLPSHPSPPGSGDKPAVRISFKSISGDFELVEKVGPGPALGT